MSSTRTSEKTPERAPQFLRRVALRPIALVCCTMALLASSLGCCGPRPKAGLKRLPVDIASPRTQKSTLERCLCCVGGMPGDAPPPPLPAPRKMSMPKHPIGGASAFQGIWQNTQTHNLEPYLQHWEVGWARRQAALAWKVRMRWEFSHDGVLVSHTEVPPPFEEQIEHFPLGNGRAHVRAYDAVGGGGEVDTEGYQYSRNSHWEGNVLVTRAKDADGKLPDVVTRRWVEAGPQLFQVVTYDGVSFERRFQRVGGVAGALGHGTLSLNDSLDS